MVLPESQSEFPSLLLIDDDPISREVMAMILEMHGYPVSSAEDGNHALKLLETSAPEVILLDTQMPGLSGADLIAALRSASNARIIAISGSQVSEAILQHTQGFLLKPVQPEALSALLNSTPTNPNTAPLPDPPQPELIDPVVLAKLRSMMSPKAVREIYAAVASDLKPRLSLLQAAMQAGNHPEVSRIAHSIKGGCAMVGLSGATGAAALLEISTTSETWFPQLAKLQSALGALEGILITDFPI